ncbi:MAG: DUF2934 domain-containing protein [Terriglobales bacterium]
MARKTTGNTTTNRSKKAGIPVQPAVVQSAYEDRKNEESANAIPSSIPVHRPVNLTVNLEEEIRRRAYELYLQRRATACGESGDENQDWLIAEREILSLRGSQDQHSA